MSYFSAGEVFCLPIANLLTQTGQRWLKCLSADVGDHSGLTEVEVGGEDKARRPHCGALPQYYSQEQGFNPVLDPWRVSHPPLLSKRIFCIRPEGPQAGCEGGNRWEQLVDQ